MLPTRQLSPGPWACYRLLLIEGVLIAALVGALGFTISGSEFRVMGFVVVLAVLAAAILRRRAWARTADGIEGAVLILASGMATGCLSVLLATLAPPLRDEALAAADRLIFPFLDWPAMAAAAVGHPLLVTWMCRVYSTLLWQPFALMLLLAATGRGAVLWRFMHSWMLALVACVAVFALVPAMTAQVHYGLSPGSIAGLSVDAGWHPSAIMMAARTGALRTLASSSMAGMISFPSFHTAGALLLGWGFWQAGGAWCAMALLEGAMLVTVPLVGSHYFTDMLGGAAVAWTSLAATQARAPRPQAEPRMALRPAMIAALALRG